MEKKQLPKLDTDGFKTLSEPSRFRWDSVQSQTKDKDINNDSDIAGRTSASREGGWKGRAAGFARRIRPMDERDKDKMDDDEAGYKRLLIKTGICAGIAIAILVISSINTPTANNITDAIDQAVNHEFDIEEDIGRLKFVQNLEDETQSVFSPMPEVAAVFPADGDIITRFGEGGSKGVRINPIESQIVCIAKGTVTQVGLIDDKGYVKIVLDAGETAVFYNVTPGVKVDDIVMPGQPIGEVIGEFFYLELQDGDEYIDPLEYIQKRSAMALQ